MTSFYRVFLTLCFVITLIFLSVNPVWAAGQIPFTINLSEAVTVTGMPRIRMDVGGATRYATYTSGTGTSALTFTYQMVSGDVDADGVQLFSPMELNGGTITDLHGNAISNLAFAVPNTAGIKVNAAVPSGYSVAINTKDIIGSNQNAFAFNLNYNKTNRTYNYSISSSGGGTPVTGSGTTTGALQTVSGINVSSLPDGLLTLSVTLTDSLGGVLARPQPTQAPNSPSPTWPCGLTRRTHPPSPPPPAPSPSGAM